LLTVEASAGAQTLEATPWPSDLFLDEAGHVALQALPHGGTALADHILRDLHELQDGFGVTTGAFFPVDGAIVAETLAGNAYLLDLGTGESLPVEPVLRHKGAPTTIFVRPRLGGVLLERHHYAYVLTDGVRGADGPLQASDGLKQALGGEGRGGAIYAALLPVLATNAIAVEHVAAATVFTTHSITRTLRAARLNSRASAGNIAVQHVWAASPTADDDGSIDALIGAPPVNQPGLDNDVGLEHAHVAFFVQGTFTAPDYLNAETALTALGGTPAHPGVFDDADGVITARGTATIPFTLAVPIGAEVTALPVVLFQYGLDGDASSNAAVAETHAQAGFATFTIDIPFHGGRDATAFDDKHLYGGAVGADGWAETADEPALGFFDVIGNPGSDVESLEPRAIRAAFQQAAVDISAGVGLLGGGDWSALGAREPRLGGLKFSTARLSFTGISFGSIIGGIVTAIEPEIGAASLDVGGGGLLTSLLLHSAVYGPLFGLLLDDQLGTTALSNPDDPPDSDFTYSLLAYLIEAGDPLAYAPYVARAPLSGSVAKHVFLSSAYLDESVPNVANIALGRALGLQVLELPGATADLSLWPDAVRASGTLGDNGPGGTTAAFVQFEQATHGMMYYRKATRRYDLTQPFPYPLLPAPALIDNPIDRVHAMVIDFVKQYGDGGVPIVRDRP
jgi:hypothetical protein